MVHFRVKALLRQSQNFADLESGSRPWTQSVMRGEIGQLGGGQDSLGDGACRPH